MYQVDWAGNAVIHPDGVDYLHDLKHLIIDGYKRRIDPLDTIRGNLLTPQIVMAFWRTPESTPPGDDFDIPGYRAYIADQVEVTIAK